MFHLTNVKLFFFSHIYIHIVMSTFGHYSCTLTRKFGLVHLSIMEVKFPTISCYSSKAVAECNVYGAHSKIRE